MEGVHGDEHDARVGVDELLRVAKAHVVQNRRFVEVGEFGQVIHPFLKDAWVGDGDEIRGQTRVRSSPPSLTTPTSMGGFFSGGRLGPFLAAANLARSDSKM